MQNVFDPNQSQPQNQSFASQNIPNVPPQQNSAVNLSPSVDQSGLNDTTSSSQFSSHLQDPPITPPTQLNSTQSDHLEQKPPLSPIDEYVPPVSSTESSPDIASAAASVTPQSTSQPDTSNSENIADQNIFEMLGVTDGTPEQREQFLDELQAVIWDDFIEHDTQLLLTDEEQKQLQDILKPDPKAMENQEKAVVFLEKLIPDLEEIMLEKALQLKEEMFRERLRAMTELYRNDQDKQQKIVTAQAHVDAKEWRSATVALNSLK